MAGLNKMGAPKPGALKPSSGIEPEQADTSSMVVESAQMADLNKMDAPKPAASKDNDVPNDFKGCKCKQTKCQRTCGCYQNDYPCTWKCRCVGCGNTFGNKESDVTRPASWCKCPNKRCMNKTCKCVKDGNWCTPKCECKRCINVERNGTDRQSAETAS